MSQVTANFKQSPPAVRRYLIDYSLDLSTGESVASVADPTVTSPSGELSPTLVVSNVVLAPAVNGIVSQVTFFLSGGTSGQNYEVEFLTTTTLTQVFDDVIGVVIAVKT